MQCTDSENTATLTRQAGLHYRPNSKRKC
ncbi:unnamed protein product [Spodoptera littoralis]|uniref:Uncharacterized protein n=1 Tax=Spodoptera littoralis TaxID=7109 RepID=A0A9P0HWH0_SPOLI|nr:unnamed protein product [Spodoptera littoralis]CAH1635095.1 unnamed protein product [Spodoptera littoralis]